MYAQYTTNILTGLTTFKNIPKALYIELMTSSSKCSTHCSWDSKLLIVYRLNMGIVGTK